MLAGAYCFSWLTFLFLQFHPKWCESSVKSRHGIHTASALRELLHLPAPGDLRGLLLQVTECLQVKGHPNIYALGDATDIKETKLGYLAAAHVSAYLKSMREVADERIDSSLSATSLPCVSLRRKNVLWSYVYVTRDSLEKAHLVFCSVFFLASGRPLARKWSPHAFLTKQEADVALLYNNQHVHVAPLRPRRPFLSWRQCHTSQPMLVSFTRSKHQILSWSVSTSRRVCFNTKCRSSFACSFISNRLAFAAYPP